MELSKEEAIVCYTAIENVVIKGKDARMVSPLLDKLDKFISSQIEATGQPDISQIPGASPEGAIDG